MRIEIRDLRKKDYKKAIQFAITGMHFDWYLNNKFLLNAYGRYFWYLELNRATQIFAAYVNGKFATCFAIRSLIKMAQLHILYLRRLKILLLCGTT